MVSGAKAQFESLGPEGWDELAWIVSSAAIEMCCLETEQVDRWVDLALTAMERIIRILNLPPAQFTVTTSPTTWRIPIAMIPLIPEDTNRFSIALDSLAIAEIVDPAARRAALLPEIWRKPFEFLLHHHSGPVSKFILMDLLGGLRGRSPSIVGEFVRQAAQACGIKYLVIPPRGS